MPRYDPLPSTDPTTVPAPTVGLPPQGVVASAPANPQRYQQLTMDQSTAGAAAGGGGLAGNQPRYNHNHHPRSPFACGACFDSIEPVVAAAAVALTPNRKAVTGYAAGFLVSVGKSPTFLSLLTARYVFE